MRDLVEKYSLAWLQMTSIILFTIIGGLIHLLWQIREQMTQSRARVETVCDSIRSTSEQIFQGPYLLVNASIKSAYTAKENILRTINSGIIILEKIIIWLIQTYKSTYRCLLLFVIDSVLSILKIVLGPLQKAAEGISSLVTGSSSSGKLGDWTQTLSDIQAKIDQWFKLDDGFVQGIINKPFEALSGQLNATLGSWQPSLLQQKESPAASLLECNIQDISHLLDNIEKSAISSIMMVIGVLVALFFICTIINTFYIRIRHKFAENMRWNFKESHITKESIEKYIWATYESSWIPWEKRDYFSFRLFRYMSHPMVVYCLLTGLCGLIVTHSAQWLVEKQTMELYSEFDNKLNIWIADTTLQWKTHALDQFQVTNRWIDETEAELNNKAFDVVKSTAFTLNNTLSLVVSQIQTSIDNVLGGTIFETPAKDVVNCLLLNKIESMESGLTWIYENAYVNLTRIDLPFLQTDIYEPKIKSSIQKHLAIEKFPISIDNLQTFYYLLLSLWTLSLLIGICLQCYYFFLYKKE